MQRGAGRAEGAGDARGAHLSLYGIPRMFDRRRGGYDEGMKLHEFLDAVLLSNPKEWRRVDHPHNAAREGGLEHGVLTTDLRVWMSVNRSINDNFVEPWANAFPDPHAQSFYADLMFGASPVLNVPLVQVDGRGVVPLPKAVAGPGGQREAGKGFVHVARIAHRIMGGAWDFDDYLNRAGIVEVDPPWDR